uniref:Semaphorin-1A-like protein n=1 Tax=Trachysalambria curvirostris majanivirus TaxID=2984281 RepID=A0A9C7BWP7_9VIRU|nr:MAG: semaphorin-1A-like protein [Trachysalambria curvirostris majanivirus]
MVVNKLFLIILHSYIYYVNLLSIYNIEPTNKVKTLDNIEINKIIHYNNSSKNLSFYKLLYINNDYIVIGGSNITRFININNLTEDTNKQIIWKSENKSISNCLRKGKSFKDCQNYIRVFIRYNETRFLLCGTNAYNPLCRLYDEKDNLTYTTINGVGFCPFGPNQTSTHIYTNNQLYSATDVNFQGSTFLIRKGDIKTDPNNYEHLYNPTFLQSFEYEEFVYFFFRETGIESLSYEKTVFSRVARVCKGDEGDTTKKKWTSFLKSRLNCSSPGEPPFYFDELQSLTKIISGNYGDIVYGIFKTPHNSIPGSVICAFSIKDIQKVFRGKFKALHFLERNDKEALKPRPQDCMNNSGTLSVTDIVYRQWYTLMDEAVPGLFRYPLGISNFKYQLTRIAVDPQVKYNNNKTVDVIFAATSEGLILKIIIMFSSNDISMIDQSFIVEEIRLSNTPLCITNIHLIRNNLLIITHYNIQSFKIERCHRATSCSSCVQLRDPYCGWKINEQKCIALNAYNNNNTQDIVQDISGYNIKCCNISLYDLPTTESTINKTQTTTTFNNILDIVTYKNGIYYENRTLATATTIPQNYNEENNLSLLLDKQPISDEKVYNTTLIMATIYFILILLIVVLLLFFSNKLLGLYH